jgi:hypothetical protein
MTTILEAPLPGIGPPIPDPPTPTAEPKPTYLDGQRVHPVTALIPLPPQDELDAMAVTVKEPAARTRGLPPSLADDCCDRLRPGAWPAVARPGFHGGRLGHVISLVDG